MTRSFKTLLLAAFTLILLAFSVDPVSAHGGGSVDWWHHWSWRDLPLLIVLGAVYGLGVRSLWKRAGRGKGISKGRAAAFGLAMIVLVAALVSPLDALSDELFSAHMVQHLLLVLVAAPLFVLGQFDLALVWALPSSWVATVWKKWKGKHAWNFLMRPLTASLFHTAALWIWHLPRLYEAARRNEWLHFMEHASFFLTAVLFWQMFAGLAESAYNGRSTKFGMAIFTVFGIAMVSGLLGVLIAFSPYVWYPSHIHEAPVFGLTALEDQQLAGTLMWVPAGVVYLACALGVLGRWLLAMEALESRRLGGRSS